MENHWLGARAVGPQPLDIGLEFEGKIRGGNVSMIRGGDVSMDRYFDGLMIRGGDVIKNKSL